MEFYQSCKDHKASAAGGLATEVRNSARVWLAASAGAPLTATDQIMDKLDKVLLTNPDSEFMKRISQLPPAERLELFPALARQAIAPCHTAKKALRGSNHCVGKVVSSDPDDEVRAWARVHVFLPYCLGDAGPSVVVDKKAPQD